MKGEIVLSQKEIQRVRVMEQVMQGVLSAVDAGGYLGLSYRQVKRLKARYREAGPAGLMHGNRAQNDCLASKSTCTPSPKTNRQERSLPKITVTQENQSCFLVSS